VILPKIASILRNCGLMPMVDKARYLMLYTKNFAINQRFRNANPDVVLPPDYMMYESFKLDYDRYYNGGNQSAKEILNILGAYKELQEASILDWGCGPARITRHLPTLLPKAKVYGTDYNDKTIEWNTENISAVSFSKNTIDQRLSYSSDAFDVVIGISIFTHLSEENHTFWIKELNRILNNGGLAFITTAGESFKSKMTREEISAFDQKQLVIRSEVMEGHRTFAAFQPKPFFKKLVDPYFTVLQVKEGEKKDWGVEQDFWVLRKKM
jgi:2-polyprenyl-3-methyl-5-hydroxy-6-metoxy-1,4-benzoquinol methylase